MLVHRRVTPSINFAGTHLYTWVERGTVRVKCLAQEHNTMSPARAQTRTARSRDERTNHEATAPPFHCRSLPRNLLGFPNNLQVRIYTPGWKEALQETNCRLPKNTTQCPRPGFKPGPLDLGMSALAMRPLHLYTFINEC